MLGGFNQEGAVFLWLSIMLTQTPCTTRSLLQTHGSKGELLSEMGVTCPPRGILTAIPARAKEAVRKPSFLVCSLHLLRL